MCYWADPGRVGIHTLWPESKATRECDHELYTIFVLFGCAYSSNRVNFLGKPGGLVITRSFQGDFVSDHLISNTCFFQSYFDLKTTKIRS